MASTSTLAGRPVDAREAISCLAWARRALLVDLPLRFGERCGQADGRVDRNEPLLIAVGGPQRGLPGQNAEGGSHGVLGQARLTREGTDVLSLVCDHGEVDAVRLLVQTQCVEHGFPFLSFGPFARLASAAR
ncbi:hypothetical protein [Streptomyces sp. NPDC054834]